jgi:hypothetical protein
MIGKFSIARIRRNIVDVAGNFTIVLLELNEDFIIIWIRCVAELYFVICAGNGNRGISGWSNNEANSIVVG